MLKSSSLAMCGDVDELVAALDVTGARVVLHHAAHRAALGVKDREARADLAREGEEVEFGAESSVVAQFGLLEELEVRRQGGVALPRGAVDALELGTMLVAAPVGARDAGQLEVAESRRRGHVGTAAEVA